MEEATSSEEPTQSAAVANKEEEISNANFMFYFAKNYAKLQTQINGVKNSLSRLDSDVAMCLSDNQKKLDDMEKKVAAITSQFDYVKYYVNELARDLEDVQKDVVTLKSAHSRREEAEKFLKNIGPKPRP